MKSKIWAILIVAILASVINIAAFGGTGTLGPVIAILIIIGAIVGMIGVAIHGS